MTWQWSHSPEAYENAYQNLLELPREQLEIIYAEWMASYKGDEEEVILQGTDAGFFNSNQFTQFDSDKHDIALKVAKTVDHETLVSLIWGYATQLEECDNGGFNAYVCPFHCHSVSFSSPSEVE